MFREMEKDTRSFEDSCTETSIVSAVRSCLIAD